MDQKRILSDIKQIPRERWGFALGLVLCQGLDRETLLAIAAGGEEEFVRVGALTDILGLQAEDYRRAFSRIARKAAQLAPQVVH